MIVEDLADNGTSADDDPTEIFQGVLIAHEFGHTKGLRHREERSVCTVTCSESGVCFDECAVFPPIIIPTLMSPFIGRGSNVINNAECTALMRPLPAPASAPCDICEGDHERVTKDGLAAYYR